MPDAVPINVPPAEAIAYFRRKGYRISFSWQDVYAVEHARAFTVAKAMSLDILEDIRAAVDKAISEGVTFQEFRRSLEPTLQEKGWWGQKRITDPLTGEEREVQLGSPRRLRTIYDVNLRTAYAAGSWERIQRTKERRPYLRYVAILDGRTRPHHRGWHGTVLPADHPWWQTHYPPNGWGCRCSVQQLSERDLERFGYSVTDDPPDTGLTRTWTNPRTGEIRRVPLGIDPGWDYNPGMAGEEHAARLLAEKVAAVDAPEIGAQVWAGVPPATLDALERDYARWARGVLARGGEARNEVYPVGALSPRVIDFLRSRGEMPDTAGIRIGDREFYHLVRPNKAARQLIPLEFALRLPSILARPRAVLWDKKHPALLYVFDVPADGMSGKFVVRVNYRLKVQREGRREKVLTNSVRTAGQVPDISLRNPGEYEIVEGAP